MSEQATLHMEGDPALVQPIVGGSAGSPVPAVPTRSLAFTGRPLLDLTWAVRRAGMVAAVTG